MPSCRAKIVCSSVDGAARSQQIFSVGIGLEASATLYLKTKLWGRHRTAVRVHVAQRAPRAPARRRRRIVWSTARETVAIDTVEIGAAALSRGGEWSIRELIGLVRSAREWTNPGAFGICSVTEHKTKIATSNEIRGQCSDERRASSPH